MQESLLAADEVFGREAQSPVDGVLQVVAFFLLCVGTHKREESDGQDLYKGTSCYI